MALLKWAFLTFDAKQEKKSLGSKEHRLKRPAIIIIDIIIVLYLSQFNTYDYTYDYSNINWYETNFLEHNFNNFDDVLFLLKIDFKPTLLLLKFPFNSPVCNI